MTWFFGSWKNLRSHEEPPTNPVVKAEVNKERWELNGEEKLETSVKRRKWKWIGHTLRNIYCTEYNVDLDYLLRNTRVGRSNTTWRRIVRGELMEDSCSIIKHG